MKQEKYKAAMEPPVGGLAIMNDLQQKSKPFAAQFKA